MDIRSEYLIEIDVSLKIWLRNRGPFKDRSLEN